jgi:hypothetical protein
LDSYVIAGNHLWKISGGIEIRFGKIGIFRNANILLDETKKYAIMNL